MLQKDTIAAIATGLTEAGIGIVRISGPCAVEVGNRLFRSPSGKRILDKAESHMMRYGFVVSFKDNSINKNYDFDSFGEENKGTDWKNFIIDEVMAVVMKAPRSFTGEDTVEIQCHGGIFVMQKILNAALRAGARLAEPGEFTKRAFLNGRMDLSRAEAVMDLIHSRNEYALAASISQLNGNLSEKIKKLRSELLYETAFIESALDDPEHISLDGYSEGLKKRLDKMTEEICKLISTFESGKLIREGIKTVIVGKPNAGKSSLMNLLLGEERAIVTDVAGTTRDVLCETVKLHNIQFHIVDTAGIRDTENTVEKIGVDRAKKYAQDADLAVYVADSSVPLDENDKSVIQVIKNKKVVVLLNKSDIEGKVTEKEIRKLFLEVFDEDKKNNEYQKAAEKIHIIKTSAKDGSGIDSFLQTVRDMFFQGEIRSNHEIMITNARHREALQDAYESLLLVKKSMEEHMPEDFYFIDLMDAYTALGKILGEEVDDDLVQEIFSKFCMGK